MASSSLYALAIITASLSASSAAAQDRQTQPKPAAQMQIKDSGVKTLPAGSVICRNDVFLHLLYQKGSVTLHCTDARFTKKNQRITVKKGGTLSPNAFATFLQPHISQVNAAIAAKTRSGETPKVLDDYDYPYQIHISMKDKKVSRMAINYTFGY